MFNSYRVLLIIGRFSLVASLLAMAIGCAQKPAETTTPGYDDLRVELSYKWKPARLAADNLSEVSIGISGSNLLNRDIRNSVSYSKDEVLMPGASVRLFTSVKY